MPLDSTFTNFFVAAVLIFGQALYFNFLCSKYKLIAQTNFLPALSYILISSVFTAWFFLSPAMLCNFVLLILIDQIFSVYKKEKAADIIFNIGFTLGTAFLFYQQAVVFLFFIFIALIILRPFYLREWILMFTGTFVLVFLCGVYFYWNDELPIFLKNFSVHVYLPSLPAEERRTEYILKASFFALIFLISIFKINEQFRKAVVQTRNYFTTFIWFFISGLPIVFLGPQFDLQSFFWLVIPLSFGLCFWFTEVRRIALAEFLHLSLLLCILWYQYSDKIF